MQLPRYCIELSNHKVQSLKFKVQKNLLWQHLRSY